MMKKQYALILVAVIVLTMAISAVYARSPRGDEEEVACIAKPATAFGLAMMTESAVYLFSGGMGPLLIVALAVVIAVILTHVLWTGF